MARGAVLPVHPRDDAVGPEAPKVVVVGGLHGLVALVAARLGVTQCAIVRSPLRNSPHYRAVDAHPGARVVGGARIGADLLVAGGAGRIDARTLVAALAVLHPRHERGLQRGAGLDPAMAEA